MRFSGGQNPCKMAIRSVILRPALAWKANQGRLFPSDYPCEGYVESAACCYWRTQWRRQDHCCAPPFAGYLVRSRIRKCRRDCVRAIGISAGVRRSSGGPGHVATPTTTGFNASRFCVRVNARKPQFCAVDWPSQARRICLSLDILMASETGNGGCASGGAGTRGRSRRPCCNNTTTVPFRST